MKYESSSIKLDDKLYSATKADVDEIQIIKDATSIKQHIVDETLETCDDGMLVEQHKDICDFGSSSSSSEGSQPVSNKIYGVSWSNGSSTTMTRTDDAIEMTYLMDTSTGKVVSDFDHVFPYNQMKRQVINGNTFVYVPAMWFRVGVDSSQRITSVAVSGVKGEGDNWYSTRPFYYGAYGASSDGTILKSVSGVSRLNNVTRATARQRAMAVGEKYHQKDLYASTILMFLWWIEFATKNSSSVTMLVTSSTGLLTGNTDELYNDVEGNDFCVTGRVYKNASFQIMWHGIEDYLGNYFEFEDGVTGNGTASSTIYASDNYTLYDDYSGGSQMSSLSYRSTFNNTYKATVVSIGWDKDKPFLCLPMTHSLIDDNWKTYFCDGGTMWSNKAVVTQGRVYDSYGSEGLVYISTQESSYKNSQVGCRLMKEA